jgi:hypothetical protein
MSNTKYRVGPSAAITWIWSGGTVNLAQDYTQFSAPREIELLESTAGNVEDKEYVTGLKDGKASLRYFDTTQQGTVLEAAMKEGTFGTLVYGRRGTATGMPKRGFAAYVKSFDDSMDFNKLAECNVEFQKTGAMVYDVGAVYP